MADVKQGLISWVYISPWKKKSDDRVLIITGLLMIVVLPGACASERESYFSIGIISFLVKIKISMV